MKTTSKRTVEQELRASEQRYRLLADNITDVIWTIDLDGNFTYVSPSVERLRGFTPEEVMKQSITEALTPDSLQIVLESLEQLRDVIYAGGDLSGVDHCFELEQPCKDGSTVWTEVITNILWGDQDNIIGILGVTRDITEWKRAEDALKQAHDELAVRVSELAMLNHIAETVATATDLQAALEILAEQMVVFFEAASCATTLLSADQRGLHVLAHFQRKKSFSSLVGRTFFLDDHLADRTVVETGKPMMVTPEMKEAAGRATCAWMKTQNIGCLLIVPMVVRGRVVGTISVGTDHPRRTFTSAEVSLAETIAGQVAGTIENNRLFEEERRQRQVAESLREVALILNSSLDLDTVLGKIYGQLQQVINNDSVGIFLKEGSDLVLISGTELDMPYIGTRISLASDDIAVRVFKDREPLIIADVHQSPYREMWFGDKNLRTWMGVPLLVGETVIGVLTVDSFRVEAYTGRDAQNLQIFAAQAATAIENARRFEAEHKALEQAKTLYTASLALSATTDLPQVLERILTELRRVVPYDSASVQEFKGDNLEIVSGTGFPNPAEIIGLTFDFGESELNRELAQTQVPVILEDAALHPEFQVEPHSKLGIRAWMGIPLLFGDRFMGKISIDKKTPGFYDEATAQLAMSFAVQAAVAIEHARLLDEAQEARAAAEAANKAKSTFLATMSHELRTPLNAILGYAQLIKRDPASTENQREGLEIIEQSGTHLLTIVNDLLDVAKIEAGKVDLHLTDIHLPDFLRSICEIIGIRAERKGITFQAQFPPVGELPRRVWADEKRLRQVLINLLGNGVKFTNDGWVSFRVETVSPLVSGDNVLAEGPLTVASNVTIRFTIQDTGVGIPPDELQSIFEPFYQTGELKHRAEGTGLGLAICINLLELMGSQLSVESEVRQGSKFWFDLTLEQIWTESTSEHRDSASAESLIIPPAEELLILYDLSLRGEVDEIGRRAAELAGKRQYGQFAARLKHLAAQFQLNEITELLRGYLE